MQNQNFHASSSSGGFGGNGGFMPHHQDQPPPPPMHHMDMAGGNGEVLNSFRGLNISDPRYAAKYGNPYLRQGTPSAQGTNVNAAAATSSPQMARTVNFASTVGRPYATLNTRPGNNGYNQVNNGGIMATGRNGHSAAAAQNYAGTMLGNGSLSRSGKKNGGSNGSNPQSQYIMSPDNNDVKGGSLATHV